MFVAQVVETAGGGGSESLTTEPFCKAGGHFATINFYHTSFDPQNPVGFKYLVQILIRKGLRKTFMFLDNILKPIKRIADRDIAEGTKHHKITILISTVQRRFKDSFVVDFEDNKSAFVDLKYHKPLLRCARCFSLDHKERGCTVTLDQRVVPPCLLPGPPQQPNEGDRRPWNDPQREGLVKQEIPAREARQ